MISKMTLLPLPKVRGMTDGVKENSFPFSVAIEYKVKWEPNSYQEKNSGSKIANCFNLYKFIFFLLFLHFVIKKN